MNRRFYLKSILAVGGLGVASFSAFKWFDLNQTVDPKQLLLKRNIIAELVEMIIPETQTPGAKAAMVHDYVINVILNCNPVRQQQRFFSGLESMEKYAVDQYGKDFLKCSMAEKEAVLENSASHSGYSNRILNKINNKLLGTPFYFKLRELTVEGYCLSMLGATQGLAYDYIPHTYEACIPLLPYQKSWATK